MPEIVGIHLLGGLGNALFQFAFIYSLSLKLNCKFAIPNIDTWGSPHQTVEYTWFKNLVKSRDNFTNDSFEPQAIVGEYCPFIYKGIEVPDVDCILYKEYFQCKSYIDVSVYKLVKDALMETIDTSRPLDTDGIFLHIRLGDYANDPDTVLEDGYYERAVKHFDGEVIHVFSNDVELAKDTLPPYEKYMFIKDLNEIDSLYYMTCFEKGGICANSSYSWWASQLNFSPIKQIVMPRRWWIVDKEGEFDVYPEGCIKY